MQRKQIANLKCWEIMNCDNQDCLARNEPETPCWEIAKHIKEGLYDPSKICRECVVYLLKQESSMFTEEDIDNILKSRGITEKNKH